MTRSALPCLVGYPPEEAERIAAAAGYPVRRVEAPPPRWLPPRRQPRVGRQRTLPDGTVELLIVLVPVINQEDQGG